MRATPKETATIGQRYPVLVLAAAFVVVVGGIRVAAPLVVPFLLAAFLAVLSAPPMLWLEEKGLHRALALLVVFGSVFAVVSGMGMIVGGSIDGFTRLAPELEASLVQRKEELLQWLREKGAPVESADFQFFDPAIIVRLVRDMFNGLGTALGRAFLIFLTVLFILAEISSFPLKFRAILPSARESVGFQRFTASIRNYIAIKTATSLATGVLIAVYLHLIDVQFPVLWGLLAFLLNFVPNVGSILAALPPALLALMQQGIPTMLWTGFGFLVVNTLIGSFLEPRVMGRGLGLSPLVVFVSLVFWGWVLGPVGMFLSVPLTMTIKIALEANRSTRWISILLGSEADAREALQKAGA